MKHQLILTALLLFGASSVWGQSAFDDDIYYNPDKAKTSVQEQKKEKKRKSNYIANMADMDVDTYNRRGEAYYTTPVDTIGSYIENGEDFVYTQQIQKYYNPTIVVDNADVLGDVLANAYGNVEIVIDNNGLPVFSPYSYSWGWPYYSSWWTSPSWRFNVGLWGWNIGFYDPWYSWSWGPSWTWGYGPAWSWGPGWGYGPGWGLGWGPAYPPGGWGPRPPMASWRPNGNRPAGARPGWSATTRPGGNMAHRNPSSSGYRPGNHRPISSMGGSGSNSVRPGNGVGVNNNNGRWEYNTTGTTGHRKPGTGVVNSGNSNRNYGNSGVNNNNSNRGTGVSNSHRNTNSGNSYNNRNNSGSRNNGSYSPGRSSGGSFGGGRSTGGGGRSGGGRGGRR
ncbi:MAG: hypothetical protein K2J48_04640 [Muribaculaceae bacterium]|nr:hypothetical protein [Muribaculaceae bacterium]